MIVLAKYYRICENRADPVKLTRELNFALSHKIKKPKYKTIYVETDNWGKCSKLFVLFIRTHLLSSRSGETDAPFFKLLFIHKYT